MTLVNGDIYLFVVKDFLYFRWLFAVRYTTNTNTHIYTHTRATKLVSSYETALSSPRATAEKWAFDSICRRSISLTASNENNSRACIGIEMHTLYARWMCLREWTHVRTTSRSMESENEWLLSLLDCRTASHICWRKEELSMFIDLIEV